MTNETTKETINYQQIYEDELSESVKTSLELPRGFYELSHHQRMMVEELVDLGARVATELVLDPEVLRDTASLAAEMGTQLYQFANMVQGHVHDVSPIEDESV